jgi:UPF0271 protein
MALGKWAMMSRFLELLVAPISHAVSCRRSCQYLNTLKQAAAKCMCGAHVSYPDRVGFGRRNMDVSYDELYADVLYQISALQGLAQVAGTKVTYVKPHGALYNTIATNLTQAQAVIDAIQHSDKKLVLVALAGSPLINFARKQELALFLKRLLIVLIIVMVN